jgi:hypothetical protein
MSQMAKGKPDNMMAAASTASPHDHHDKQEYQKSSIRIPQTVF